MKGLAFLICDKKSIRKNTHLNNKNTNSKVKSSMTVSYLELTYDF